MVVNRADFHFLTTLGSERVRELVWGHIARKMESWNRNLVLVVTVINVLSPLPPPNLSRRLAPSGALS